MQLSDGRIRAKFEGLLRFAEDLMVRYPEHVINLPVPQSEYMNVRMQADNIVRQVCGEQSGYFYALRHIGEDRSEDTNTTLAKVVGVLKGAYEDYTTGFLSNIRDAVRAEVFTDFLEMAGYLLSEGYKDAAAVMTGSVLEQRLRQLCKANGVDTEVITPDKTRPKKADQLNSELAKASVYGILDQKAVTSWLDLRNKAAHGLYDQYSREQVNLMYQGVTEFLARVVV